MQINMKNIKKKKFESEYSQVDANVDISAFISTMCVVGMIGVLFFFIFSFF